MVAHTNSNVLVSTGRWEAEHMWEEDADDKVVSEADVK